MRQLSSWREQLRIKIDQRRAYNPDAFKNCSRWVASCVGEAMKDVGYDDFVHSTDVRSLLNTKGKGKGDDGNDYQDDGDDAASVSSAHTQWSAAPSAAPSARNMRW